MLAQPGLEQAAAARKPTMQPFFRHLKSSFAHDVPTLLQAKVSMHAMRFPVVFCIRRACYIANGPKAPPRTKDATKIDFLVENKADGLLEWFLRAVELMKDWTFLVSNPAGAIASVEARTEDIRRLTDIAVNDETIVAIINAQAASEIVVRGLQNAEAQWSLIKQGWIAAVFRAQKHLFGDAGSSGDVSVVSPLP